ncbi:DUF4197 domain-containing protein [Desulfotalea psychrophila]|uniref:DUF4197 domain-containing protein n=1 Tax=Desulfotalea psychrophila (strain LSv54 / DSM 12343) TaxID=177439 RepID=Q6ANG7_DESPS|nr:DUF4197 domain-containing protein [Desulfotalea psychrophila]CAG36107.1 hypothetical protein DP1378 [Desulfotalea psychrophila LSv54]
MKNYKMVSLLVLLFPLVASQASATESWFDKGMDMLKSVEKTTAAKPSVGEMDLAFKQALRLGAEKVVKQLGQSNGFNADPAIHIPLPKELNTVKSVLNKIGMSPLLDDLELRLNRAAEAATPKAQKLFLQSISEMTFDDIKTIYNGPKDSATRYFQRKMSPELSRQMQPIVEKSLAQAGAMQAFDRVVGEYQNLPFVPDVKANLTDYVVQEGMDGIFYYISQEEIAIRENPLKQTTALLQKVFGPQ